MFGISAFHRPIFSIKKYLALANRRFLFSLQNHLVVLAFFIYNTQLLHTHRSSATQLFFLSFVSFRGAIFLLIVIEEGENVTREEKKKNRKEWSWYSEAWIFSLFLQEVFSSLHNLLAHHIRVESGHN